MNDETIHPRPYRAFQRGQLDQIPQIARLTAWQRDEILAASAVFPFRVNSYVLDELIDWDAVPDDPMFRLTFPQGGMLEPADLDKLLLLVRAGTRPEVLQLAAREVQAKLNPHPAGQMQLNVPRLNGTPLRGLQHKYRETVLFFPAQGQTCHSYCTYCFRWAQFVGLEELRFAEKEADVLVRYLRAHPEVTDVLFTGGDPMVMRAQVLGRHVDALLEANLPNLRTIRIGTKALAWWPYRFVTDPDTDDVLRLFERVVARDIHLTIMAHYSHPVELSTAIARQAIARVRGTGAVVRCQAPLIRGVNDDEATWAAMWQQQVELGAIPYYMFVERDTGARNSFEVSLVSALDIFTGAYNRVSGLARTVRGPTMSTTLGKVLVEGIADFHGQAALVLKYLQARDPARVNRLFFARYDPEATWFDQLRPMSGADSSFFERSQAGGRFPAARLPATLTAKYAWGPRHSLELTDPPARRRRSRRHAPDASAIAG